MEKTINAVGMIARMLQVRFGGLHAVESERPANVAPILNPMLLRSGSLDRVIEEKAAAFSRKPYRAVARLNHMSR